MSNDDSSLASSFHQPIVPSSQPEVQDIYDETKSTGGNLILKSTAAAEVQDAGLQDSHCIIATDSHQAEPVHEPPEAVRDNLVMKIAALLIRYRNNTDIVALGQAIEWCQEIIEENPGDSTMMRFLANALKLRYEELGDEKDLEQALYSAQLAADLGSHNDSKEHIAALVTLADILRLRFNEFQRVDDINSALDILRSSFLLAGEQTGTDPLQKTCYGRALVARYQYSHAEADDLDLAGTELEKALELGSPDYEYRDAILHCLSHQRHQCFIRGGPSILNYFEEAMKFAKEALTLRPPGHHARSESLGMVAILILDKHRKSPGNPVSLEEGISFQREALALLHPNHLARRQSLCSLATLLFYHVIDTVPQKRRPAELKEAIQLFREGLAIRPTARPFDLRTSTNLSNALRLRFDTCGADEADLIECVELRLQALKHCDPAQPSYSLALFNAAAGLMHRHYLFHAAEDLEKAITLLREASSVHPYSYYAKSAIAANLANYLQKRYKEWGDVDALDESVHILEEAIRSESTPSRCTAQMLNELGNALFLRHQIADSDKDLADAIDLFRRAVELPKEAEDHSFALRDLARALSARFTLRGSMEDAAEALRLSQDALLRAPEGSTFRCECLTDLSMLYLQPNTSYRDLPASLKNLNEALQDSYFSPQGRLSAALPCLLSLRCIALRECMPVLPDLTAAYRLVLELLPRVAFFGMNPHARLQVLAKAEHISVDAAVNALLLDHPQSAIELFEQGRSLFWTQTLRLRTTFEDIPPSLRGQIVALARRLELESLASSDIDTTERRHRNEEFGRLVEQVRSLPGLARFMLHDEFATLASAASQGPVVILLANALGCFAITLSTDGKAKHVSLPKITDRWLKEQAELWRHNTMLARAEMRDQSSAEGVRLKMHKPRRQAPPEHDQNATLKNLWEWAVMPVFESLGISMQDQRQQRPRLWWCCAGSFSFLPIHAAGMHPDGPCCDTYVVSSYTPTLSALVRARKEFSSQRSQRREDTTVLIAGVPATDHQTWSPLPFIINELQVVKSAIPESQLHPLPSADDALSGQLKAGMSVGTLLSYLPTLSVLHLACHGTQDVSDPLKSGFVMQDDILTIEQLLPVPLPNAFLAYLSACETAKGDRTQPDQTVHLAAAMLFAGFKSVIGTLWSMDDCDGPVIAKIVYEKLFQEGRESLDGDTVAYALNEAVEELRRRGVGPSQWAPYVHLGL